MSADLLRRAASKAREVAEAATPVDLNNEPIPWHNAFDGTGYDDEDAEHIWLWSPAVALAVADWLNSSADLDAALKENGARGLADDSHEYAVARLLLGEAADV